MRALNRFLVAMFTVLCLLGAQQGATLHEFSHYSQSDSSFVDKQDKQQDKQLPHSKTCDKCAVYAELSSGGPAASPLVFQILDSATESSFFSPQHSSSTRIRAYAARAPPYFL